MERYDFIFFTLLLMNKGCFFVLSVYIAEGWLQKKWKSDFYVEKKFVFVNARIAADLSLRLQD